MKSRLLSKGSGPDFDEPRDCGLSGLSRAAGDDYESDQETDAEVEAFLKARIKGSIQAIGNNLERMQVVMDRMERKLAEACR
jgi:hypothetical protein